MAKHKLEQELLNDYTEKFEALIRVCHLMEKVDSDIYNMALKKASGIKMMVDYLTDNNILQKSK
jgi:hypothetical protein